MESNNKEDVWNAYLALLKVLEIKTEEHIYENWFHKNRKLWYPKNIDAKLKSIVRFNIIAKEKSAK